MKLQSKHLLPLFFLLLTFSLSFAQKKAPIFSGSFDEIKKHAHQQKKLIVIEMNADWCTICREMEQTTFVDKSVVSFIEKKYILAQFDGEKGEGEHLASKYKVRGYPTFLFFTSNGHYMGKQSGYQDADFFLASLEVFELKATKVDKKAAKKASKQ